MGYQHLQQVKGAGTEQGGVAVHQHLALGRQHLYSTKAVGVVGMGQGMLSGMAGNGFIMALACQFRKD
jgi:hypothetical protein